LESSLTNAFYAVFGLADADAIMAITKGYRSTPFEQDQLYEERPLGTGVIRGRKIANNIDDEQTDGRHHGFSRAHF
jgi:hypothetical protein